jgi:hypothetical protein
MKLSGRLFEAPADGGNATVRKWTRAPRGKAGEITGRGRLGTAVRSISVAAAIALGQLAASYPTVAAEQVFFEAQRGPWSVQGLAGEGFSLCLASASYGAFEVGVFMGTMPDGMEDYGLVFAGLEMPVPHGPGILRFSSGRVFVGQLRRSEADEMFTVRLAETYDDPSDFFRNWANGRQFELVLAGEVIGPLRLNGTRRAMGALADCTAVARTATLSPAGTGLPPQPEPEVALEEGWVDYAGPITPAGVARATALLPLATHGLLINSPGGDLAAAIRLAEAVRGSGLDTAAYELCASACVMVLAGGIERWVGQNTRVGVHQFEWVSVQRDARETQSTVGLLGRFYKTMGVDSEVVVLASETPPESMRWLSQWELRSLKLATAFYDDAG